MTLQSESPVILADVMQAMRQRKEVVTNLCNAVAAAAFVTNRDPEGMRQVRKSIGDCRDGLSWILSRLECEK
jgi:hypothetical protein